MDVKVNPAQTPEASAASARRSERDGNKGLQRPACTDLRRERGGRGGPWSTEVHRAGAGGELQFSPLRVRVFSCRLTLAASSSASWAHLENLIIYTSAPLDAVPMQQTAGLNEGRPKQSNSQR